MEKITNSCTGCRACEQLCPTGSITMQLDAEGFLQATINQKNCIDCKLCEKKCPQNHTPHKENPIEILGVRDIDSDELFKSASGGAFAVAARYILTQNGSVYGAAYIDKELHVGHLRVTSVKDLYRLQSSKYVQSNTLDTYKAVKEDLIEGLNVLYSGTPCQIAGLKQYLKIEYNNLYTMDLICHGVPSPLLFEKYLNHLEKEKIGSKIINYDFRGKKRGWGLGYMAEIRTKEKNSFNIFSSLDPYYYNFLKCNIFRECCYQCNYSTKERVGDITIGDYWGIEKEHPKFFSTKGVSCILINTEKGKQLFSAIKNNFKIQETTFEKVVKHNFNLERPCMRPQVRNSIYQGINEKEATEFITSNLKYPKTIKAIIKSRIPSFILIAIKQAKRLTL